MLSVAESAVDDFSVFASDFLGLLLVDSVLLVESALFVESALVFFSLVLFDGELVELSDAGLFVVEGFEGEEAGLIGVGFGVVMAAAVPLGLGTAAETEGAAVGAAVALVDALAFVDVLALVVVVPVVVPLVFVTPTLKLGLTPKYP